MAMGGVVLYWKDTMDHILMSHQTINLIVTKEKKIRRLFPKWTEVGNYRRDTILNWPVLFSEQSE